MIDKKSIDKLNLLHPKIRQAALDAYAEAVKQTPIGVHPVIDQTIRSYAESDHLYQLGRTIVNPDGKSKNKPMGNIITNAKGGSSWHNFALALDFHLQVNGKDVWDVNHDWMTVVNIFKKYGFSSGLDFPGSFKDPPHLERQCGQTLSTLRKLHDAHKFIPGTNYIDF
jgi:peptidoglycan L-alanyl-D-glutamate endopeptidase CwlK